MAAIAVSACISGGETSTAPPPADVESDARIAELERTVAELSAEVQRHQAIDNALRTAVARQNQEIVGLEQEVLDVAEEWSSLADSVGYRTLGAEYGWENAPVRSCPTAVGGSPVTMRSDDIVVGGLRLVGVGEYRSAPSEQFEGTGSLYQGSKVLALVGPGNSYLLVVGEGQAESVSLGWASRYDTSEVVGGEGGWPLWVGERGVVLEACPDREAQYDGGFIVAGAQCVELHIYESENADPARFNVGFGVPNCNVTGQDP